MNPNQTHSLADTGGLPNFDQVTRTLFRGAAPTWLGMKNLREFLEVKTVINLEIFNLCEWVGAARYGMNYTGISCKPWHPEIEDVRKFLAIVRDRSLGPVFVHCRQGADRTGMMVAVYRIAVEGWTKADAIDEMVNGGFGFHGDAWPQIVPFIQGLDFSQL